MKILILDDDDQRHFGFTLMYPTDEIHKAYTAKQAIDLINQHNDFDLIHLDHSLQDWEHFAPELNKKPIEHTGREVCDYILHVWSEENQTALKKDVRVIVHSWDVDPGMKMAYDLNRAGIKVRREPYKPPKNV